jgi:hypothetical protein
MYVRELAKRPKSQRTNLSASEVMYVSIKVI